jgi:hypothetical protein
MREEAVEFLNVFSINGVFFISNFLTVDNNKCTRASAFIVEKVA